MFGSKKPDERSGVKSSNGLPPALPVSTALLQPLTISTLPTQMPVGFYPTENIVPSVLPLQQYSQCQLPPVLFPLHLSTLGPFPLQLLQDRLDIQDPYLIQTEQLFKDQFSVGVEKLSNQVLEFNNQMQCFQGTLSHQLSRSLENWNASYRDLCNQYTWYIQHQQPLPLELSWPQLNQQLQGLSIQYQELSRQIFHQPQVFESKLQTQVNVPQSEGKSEFVNPTHCPTQEENPNPKAAPLSASRNALFSKPKTPPNGAPAAQSEFLKITIVICERAIPKESQMLLNCLYIPPLGEGKSCVLKVVSESEEKKFRLFLNKPEGNQIANMVYVDQLDCNALVLEIQKSLKSKNLSVEINAIITEKDGQVIYSTAAQITGLSSRRI